MAEQRAHSERELADQRARFESELAKQSAVLRASLQQNFSKAMELFQEGRERRHQKVKLQTYPSSCVGMITHRAVAVNISMRIGLGNCIWHDHFNS